MVDIFQEIDEDLRRDRLMAIWHRHHIAIIAVIVGLLIGAGGYFVWRHVQEQGYAADATALAAATTLAADGKADEALTAYVALGEQATSASYAALARLSAAGLKLKAGDPKGAAALYDQVVAANPDPTLTKLARLLAVQALFDSADPADLEKRLAVIDGAAFGPLARELKALARLKAGDKDGARRELDGLNKDPGIPDGVRTRASQMLTALGGPLPDSASSTSAPKSESPKP